MYSRLYVLKHLRKYKLIKDKTYGWADVSLSGRPYTPMELVNLSQLGTAVKIPIGAVMCSPRTSAEGESPAHPRLLHTKRNGDELWQRPS